MPLLLCYVTVSALHLVGAGNIYFLEHVLFFDKMLVTIHKFWYVFQFFGGKGLLGSFLFLSRAQTVELNQL